MGKLTPCEEADRDCEAYQGVDADRLLASQMAREKTDLQAADRHQALENQRIDGHDTPTQIVGNLFLHPRLRGDRKNDHCEAAPDQDGQRQEEVVCDRERKERDAEHDGAAVDRIAPRQAVAEDRQSHAAERCADAVDAGQQTIAAGPTMELIRQHRIECRDRPGENTGGPDQQDQSQNARRIANIGKSTPDGIGAIQPNKGRQTHQQEGDDDGEETEAVQEKTHRRVRPDQHHTGEDRPDESGQIEAQRVQRDGVGQRVALVHHIRDERLLRRHVVGVHDAPETGKQRDMPGLNRDRMVGSEDGQHERQRHGERLRPNQNHTAWKPVRDLTAVQCEDHIGNRADAGDDAEPTWRVRQFPDEPLLRDRLHPGACHGDQLPDEEETEVTKRQRIQRTMLFEGGGGSDGGIDFALGHRLCSVELRGERGVRALSRPFTHNAGPRWDGEPPLCSQDRCRRRCRLRRKPRQPR